MTTRPVDRLYEWLAELPTPTAERIWGAGLERAESPYRERIVAALFARSSEAAWAALVAHYDRLTAEERARLRADAARWRAGLAAAARAPAARERARALTVLSEHPCPALAYLLPDALRDSAEEVRQAGARALRRVAEVVLDDPTAGSSGRSEVARAVQEALRTYDLHFRPEAVELALWFAEDLREALWKALANPRSQGSHVVHAHLDDWNGPRLAPFLLQALAQSAWRRTAQEILRQWHTPAEIAALLKHTHLLGNPEIRRRLGALKHARWFDELGEELELLPAALRGHAPQWLCHLGYSLNEKVARLSRWLHSADPGLQLGAACGLVALNVPEAVERLQEHTSGDSPLATFARWYVAGRTGASDSAAREALRPEAFAGLWQACRVQAAEEDSVLIAALRESLDTCRDELMRYLHSPDAGDRLLALRVLNDTVHAASFREQIAALTEDPVEPVRQLATALHAALPAAGKSPRPQAKPAKAGPTTTRRTSENAAPLQETLRQKLSELAASDGDPQAVAELARELRSVLRQLPDGAADALNATHGNQEAQE